MIATNSKRLTEDVLELVKNSQDARNRLQYHLKKSAPTINRWLKTNSERLTTADSLDIISEEIKIPKENLLSV